MSRQSKRVGERCERTSKRTSEWPSTYVSILVCSRPLCHDCKFWLTFWFSRIDMIYVGSRPELIAFVLEVGIGHIRSLPKLIVGVSVWRVNSAAETDPLDFASFSLLLKLKLMITQEVWVQLCPTRALLKGNKKFYHTMLSTPSKTAAVSREKFKKIKNLKITREFL